MKFTFDWANYYIDICSEIGDEIYKMMYKICLYQV